MPCALWGRDRHPTQAALQQRRFRLCLSVTADSTTTAEARLRHSSGAPPVRVALLASGLHPSAWRAVVGAAASSASSNMPSSPCANFFAGARVLAPSLDVKGCGGQACRRSAATRRLQWRSRGSPRCPAGCAPRCSSAALRPAARRVIALLCLSAPYDYSHPKPAVALVMRWCWCASAQRRCGAVCACKCVCGVLLRGCGRRGRVHGGWQRAHSGSESTQALLCFP